MHFSCIGYVLTTGLVCVFVFVREDVVLVMLFKMDMSLRIQLYFWKKRETGQGEFRFEVDRGTSS